MPVFRNSLNARTSNAVCIHGVPEEGFDHPCGERADEPYATVNSAAYLLAEKGLTWQVGRRGHVQARVLTRRNK